MSASDIPAYITSRNVMQAAGNARHCFVSEHLERLQQDGNMNEETWHDVAMVAHQILGGVSKTSIPSAFAPR